MTSTAARPRAHEIDVDFFAGAGGASTGIERATGRPVALAVDHDPTALVVHRANHPGAEHVRTDVRALEPARVAARAPIRLAWFSPDCTHHSRAKAGRPVRDGTARGQRDLAWSVLPWARLPPGTKPRIIMLENVEEWLGWGPLASDGRACPQRKGETYRHWLAELRGAGYDRIEHRLLRGCDYGAPTVRRRVFVVARCDGRAVRWPEPTHGPGGRPYRTAAQCIDWSIPTHSLFLGPAQARVRGVRRPLAAATQERIARGVIQYIVNADPPFLAPTRTGEAPSPTRATHTAAFLARHFGASTGQPVTEPAPTTTAGGQGHTALVSACLSHQHHYRPMRTLCTPRHVARVEAFLAEYGSSGASRGEAGQVAVGNDVYRIVDIGMRMLTPRELYRAQGFGDDYVIDPVWNGKPVTKTHQIRLVGNSVCPDVVDALVRANL